MFLNYFENKAFELSEYYRHLNTPNFISLLSIYGLFNDDDSN
jgi:hypothetical protein